MEELNEILDDAMDELKEKLERFLKEKDRQYREQAKTGVTIKKAWDGYHDYTMMIAGNEICIRHDTNKHKWLFRYDYSTFFEVSEKKGQAILDFLFELAKVLSPKASAANDEIVAPSRQNGSDENIAEKPLDPEDLHEEIFGERENEI